MVELIPDCLYHIFGFLTPIEWIRLSRVCRLWNNVALRHWKRITEINYSQNLNCNREIIPRISSGVADIIVFHAAPFVKVLKACSSGSGYETLVKFRHYWYIVEFFNNDNTLKLLGERGREIIDVQFILPPDVKLLQLLFKTNNIKKVKFYDGQDFYQYVPTDSIEDLDMRFSETMDTFKGHFRSLKKLTLKIATYWNYEPQLILSKVLPYILGLKSLKLFINHYHRRDKRRPASYQVLTRNIVKYSQLEELSIITGDIEIKFVEAFIKKLTIFCPNLKSITFQSFEMTDTALHSLMTLPNLECLEVHRLSGFCSLELPQIEFLTKFCVGFYDNKTIDIESLCSAVNKMPKLLHLEIYGLTKEQTLKAACEIIVTATSQGKTVIAQKLEHDQSYRKLKIQRKNDMGAAGSSYEHFQTLSMLIANYNESTYFQSLQQFVQRNLYDQHTFIFEDQEEKEKYLLKKRDGLC